MNAAIANKTIIDAWVAAWVAAFAPADPPQFYLDNELDVEPTVGQWLRVVTRERATNQETFGRRRHVRRDGSLMIQVFAPISQGALAGLTLAKVAREAVEGRTIDGVRLGVGTLRPSDNDGKWWNITIEIPFWYRELLP